MPILLILISIALSALAETVSPSLTGAGIYRIKSDHVFSAPQEKSADKLLITIAGTGAQVEEFRNVHGWGLELGYHVLGIDYPNGVISTLCQTHAEVDCYDKYRDEIFVGRPGSSLVNVNFENSIVNRIESLLRYLKKTYPERSWKRFIDERGFVKWNLVTLVGHSQGAGHAAYLGKFYDLNKVIMVGGPHDMQKGVPAKWLYLPSLTSPRRFSSLLHWQDYFGHEIQITTSKILMTNANTTVVSFHDRLVDQLNAQIFVSDFPFRDPHNSLTDPVYESAWNQLLK